MQKYLCGLLFWIAPNSSFGNQTYTCSQNTLLACWPFGHQVSFSVVLKLHVKGNAVDLFLGRFKM